MSLCERRKYALLWCGYFACAQYDKVGSMSRFKAIHNKSNAWIYGLPRLLCSLAMTADFCHFEQSALAQSKIHIESVSVVRYLYFVWWENQRFLTKKLDGLTNLATMSKNNKILLKLAKKVKNACKELAKKVKKCLSKTIYWNQNLIKGGKSGV